MSNTTATNNPHDEEFLFWQATQGQLSQEEFERLQQRLLADRACRLRYIHHMGLEADLYESYGASVDLTAPEPAPQRRLRRPLKAALAATALAAAALALVIWAPAARSPAVGETTGSGFTLMESPTSRQVAVLTEVHDLDSRDEAFPLRPGTRLPPGILNLETGAVRIEFLRGAVVRLEGPASLQLHSADAATLLRGRAAARIPPRARGFMLNAPSAACIDLGTEFSVSVDQTGASEFHVHDGEVEVSVLGEDGNTLVSERLQDADTVRVARNATGIEPLDVPSGPMPSLGTPVEYPLIVSEEYVLAVLASRPAIYWRFESLVDGFVPNSAGRRWPARVYNKDPLDPGVVVENGCARFRESAATRFIDLGENESLPRFNRRSFSIELWFNPDRLHWASLVSVVPEWDRRAWTNLNCIELAHETPLVHLPGTVRFLHRFPPGKSRFTGTNLFSPVGCTPGQWHHVVAVKSREELKLYFNGQLVRRLAMKQDSDESDTDGYRLLLGNRKWDVNYRQFIGRMDEVAIYLRELSEDEVQRHYQLIVPGG